ncbi:hypothetical protein F4802DRAFT_607581 [Xylaria palmicola]|nr:hypothetical protein F4802DRAFT_607581 [Xylaria palmicola]
MKSDGHSSPQPDQYARENQLSIDSRADPFLPVLRINDFLPQLTPDVEPSGLTSDAPLPRLHLPTADFQEDLEMPEESRHTLAGALQPDNISSLKHSPVPLARYEARKCLAELKFDCPALPSDPDYDCLELAKSIDEQLKPDVGPETFPSERLNTANDEGLQFPNSAHQFRRTLCHKVCCERFDVPKQAICHLARAIQDDWSDYETDKVLDEAIIHRTVVRDLEVTPPLSPYAANEEQFIPSVEVCDVPVASGSSSMLSDELKAAESAILQKELQNSSIYDIPVDTPRLSPLPDQPLIVGELSKISSTRMESPLSPLTSPLRSTNEGHDIPVLLASMDIDHTLSRPKTPGRDISQTCNTDNAFEHGLEAVMEESAATVLRSIEQEQISIADAVARVEVPVMDFSILEPEWQRLPMETRAHLKETIECEGNMAQLLDSLDPRETLTSAKYVWKRPGLAILRELEDEECLQETLSPAKPLPDLASLARKRRLENQLEGLGTSPPSTLDSTDQVAHSHQKPQLRTAPGNLAVQANLLPSTESSSAVSTLLSNYIDMRTAKRRKQDKSSFFPPAPGSQLESKSIPNADVFKPEVGGCSLPKTVEQPRNKVTLQAPCPRTEVSSAPTKLIKGLTLSRQLFVRLEKLYPSAEIIERDFDRWNTVAWTHHSVSRSTVVSPLAAEADLIVSPVTGIIVTTLLKVIQKPLPGHQGNSSIREHISRVALRYERLIVLVSEGNAIDEAVRDFTSSETTAYAEFIGFAAGIDSKVEVFYVGGGEGTLARWLVSFAIRHAPEAAEIRDHLLQDETQWEVFLRRLGLNAYAAQAILVRLKLRNYDSGEESERYRCGLAGFTTMSSAERLQAFRDLMGGENVLNRVNKMLETKWS